jgi:hypothetical protein
MFISPPALKNLVNIGRRRVVVEKLVVLVSVGFAIEEKSLVGGERTALRVRPSAIVPNDFRSKHCFAKNLVEKAAYVVRGIRVAMEKDRPGRLQDAAELP